MADIFLSYSSKDKDRISLLVEILEGQGWSVWWDLKIRIGKTFDQVIEEELIKAKCVVVLLSKNSIQSDWVKSEAAEGKQRQILAPVLIDNVPIPLEFRRTETANLIDWNGDLSHPELQLLLSAVREIIGQSISAAETGEKIPEQFIEKAYPLSNNQNEGKKGLSKTFITLGIIGILAVVLFGIFFVGFFIFSPGENKIKEINKRPPPDQNSNNLKNNAKDVKENVTNTGTGNRVNRFNLRNPNIIREPKTRENK